ncbi:MAG: hypothetical protein ABF289_08780 [Clostridiales bacterium]
MQIALLGIIQSEDFENEILKRREYVQRKKDIAIKALDKYCNSDILYTILLGGLSIWLELPKDIDPEELLQKAREYKLNFLPGHIFFSSNYNKNYLRLSYSHLADECITKGIQILCELIDNY